MWESVAFSGIFLALGFSCSQALSTPAHTPVPITAPLNEEVGVFWSSWALVFIAYIFLQQGEIVQARETFHICIQQFEEANGLIGIVFAIEGLAKLNIHQGQHERATRLFAWADAMRDSLSNRRPPVEQKSVEKDLAVIHSKLNHAEFAKFSEEGSAMTPQQSITLALDLG